MDNYYVNYLVNSEIYKNLNTAMNNINIQIDNLKSLEKSFSDASGNNIDRIKEDLGALITELTNYHTAVKNAYDTLNNNAKKFDNVLKGWIAKKGQDYITPQSIPVVPIEDPLATNKSRCYYEKITDVSINSDGYISLRVKKYCLYIAHFIGSNTVREENVKYENVVVGFDDTVSSSA